MSVSQHEYATSTSIKLPQLAKYIFASKTVYRKDLCVPSQKWKVGSLVDGYPRLVA